MHKIDKSFFPTEEHENAFQRLCNNHIGELRAHKEHMRMVKKTEGLDHNDPNKYQPYPAPHAHPDVAQAVVPYGDDDFNVQYELFDSRTLDEKKQEWFAKVTEEASALQEKIYPMRKRSLLSMKAQKIQNERSEAISKGEKIPDEDQKVLDLNMDVAKKTHDIIFHLATLNDEIQDLTEANIDQFKPDPFPEV